MPIESQYRPSAALEAMALLRGSLQNGYAPASEAQLVQAVHRLRRQLGDDDAAAHCALLWAMTHAAELSVGVAAKAYDLDPDAVLDHLTLGLQRVDRMR
ncbi:hypothetical protein ABZ916_35570 [Streptomyces sp. NPDC046853]|uniref:hypothetical protein n=1 Tax=Streptomyces sp. NPDC046853 TaxID=3154920 RepID=UPI0033C05D5E